MARLNDTIRMSFVNGIMILIKCASIMINRLNILIYRISKVSSSVILNLKLLIS